MRCLVLLATLTSAAQADTPAFVALDRTTGTTNAGAHVGVMFFEDQDSDGGQPNLEQPRVQLFGEYAITENFGAVASANVIWFRAQVRSKVGLGAMHLGGYLRHAHNAFEIVGRASLVLPTSTFIPRDSYYEDVAVHGTMFPWLQERANADIFWMQIGGSMRYRGAAFVAQIDGFVDVPLEETMSNTPARLHLGVGAAYLAPPWRVGVELLASGYPSATKSHEDSYGDDGETMFVGLTGSLSRTLAPGRELVAWFGNPLNDRLRSLWHSLGIGYQSSL